MRYFEPKLKKKSTRCSSSFRFSIVLFDAEIAFAFHAHGTPCFKTEMFKNVAFKNSFRISPDGHISYAPYHMSHTVCDIRIVWYDSMTHSVLAIRYGSYHMAQNWGTIVYGPPGLHRSVWLGHFQIIKVKDLQFKCWGCFLSVNRLSWLVPVVVSWSGRPGQNRPP